MLLLFCLIGFDGSHRVMLYGAKYQHLYMNQASACILISKQHQKTCQKVITGQSFDGSVRVNLILLFFFLNQGNLHCVNLELIKTLIN